MDTQRLARLLGYAGLIPFIVLAAGARGIPAWLGEGFSLSALAFYAAVIVSFMAGLHWAYAIAVPSLDDRMRRRLLTVSVAPPILVWILLSLVGQRHVLLVAAVCLVAIAVVDARLRREPWFPPWFWRLRVQLTTVAVIALVLAYL
jgi:hypothetical protein